MYRDKFSIWKILYKRFFIAKTCTERETARENEMSVVNLKTYPDENDRHEARTCVTFRRLTFRRRWESVLRYDFLTIVDIHRGILWKSSYFADIKVQVDSSLAWQLFISHESFMKLDAERAFLKNRRCRAQITLLRGSQVFARTPAMRLHANLSGNNKTKKKRERERRGRSKTRELDKITAFHRNFQNIGLDSLAAWSLSAITR